MHFTTAIVRTFSLLTFALLLCDPSFGQDEDIDARISSELNVLRGASDSVDLSALQKATSERNSTASKESTATLEAKFQTFTELGPDNIGGRVRAFAIHPTISGRIFVGSPGGGLWRTDDGGQHWDRIENNINYNISHIIISPSNPNVIYAATGEAVGSRFPGGGIFKSVDSGQTWQVLSSTVPNSYGDDWTWIGRLWVHPTNPDIVLAGANNGALYKSINGGLSWTNKYTYPNPNTRIYDIVGNPANPDELLVGTTWNTQPIRSSDGGETWTPVNISSIARTVFAWSKSTPSIVYAFGKSASSLTGTLFKSIDGGHSFFIENNDIPVNPAPYASCIWVDPTDAQRVLLGGYGSAGVLGSTNGGATTSWLPFSPHADLHMIAAAPNYDGITNATIFLSSDGGIASLEFPFDAVDNNTSWINLTNGLRITQFYTISTNGTDIAGGTQDNGSLYSNSSPTAPFQDNLTWTQFAGADGGYTPLSTIPTYTGYIFAEYQNLLAILRKSPAGNVSHIGTGITDPRHYAPFVGPLLLDKDGRLLSGILNLWVLDSPLAAAASAWRILAPSDLVGGEVTAIATAPTNSDVLWSDSRGLYGGTAGLYRSTNATSENPSFTRVGHPVANFPPTSLHISQYDENWGFMTFGGTNNFGKIWETTDGAITWTDITGNLPPIPVFDVAQSPWDSSVLFAATYLGLYASGDNGVTWGPNGDSYPIQGLAWDGNTLLLGTFGRGVFRAALPGGDLEVSIVQGQTSGNIVTFTVDNLGSSIVQGIWLKVHFEASELVNYGFPPSDCALTGSIGSLANYSCMLGKLTPNSSISRTWRFGGLGGYVDTSTTVTSANEDENPNNNSAAALISFGDAAE
jgi:photosystem II stability/assembly factor-like uncharacterized protein